MMPSSGRREICRKSAIAPLYGQTTTAMDDNEHRPPSPCPKSASKSVLGRMQLTLHATRPIPLGASRSVQAKSACSVKTRRAPSRHCRDARVYGHTTTAMHDNEYISPIEYTPTPPSVLGMQYRPFRKMVISYVRPTSFYCVLILAERQGRTFFTKPLE